MTGGVNSACDNYGGIHSACVKGIAVTEPEVGTSDRDSELHPNCGSDEEPGGDDVGTDIIGEITP